jgi:hypothetical protein
MYLKRTTMKSQHTINTTEIMNTLNTQDKLSYEHETIGKRRAWLQMKRALSAIKNHTYAYTF